jgi:hypothetical protein
VSGRGDCAKTKANRTDSVGTCKEHYLRGLLLKSVGDALRQVGDVVEVHEVGSIHLIKSSAIGGVVGVELVHLDSASHDAE